MSALERICFIDSAIREHGGVRLRRVAERFEVSERQVKRDLEYMRDRLNAPLRYVRERERYEYAERYTALANIDQKALLFYVFVRAASGTLAYVPVSETAGLQTLLDSIPKALRPLAERIRYELPDYEPPDEGTMSVILASLESGRRFDVCYRDADGKETERQAAALRLLNYAGVWYCVAWDLHKSAMRIFRLSRIRSIALAKECPAGLPDQETVERYLAGSYGVFKGPDAQDAVIRFYGWARSVVEREVWHPGQKRLEGSDPERGLWVQLAIPAYRFEELLGRTLRFGSMAEPIAPESFRVAWKDEIRRMYEASARENPSTGTTGVLVPSLESV
jgi:predicted DNA-binding transcriptional regulator YafY